MVRRNRRICVKCVKLQLTKRRKLHLWVPRPRCAHLSVPRHSGSVRTSVLPTLPHLCAPPGSAPCRGCIAPHAPWLDTRGHIGTRPPAIQRRIRSLRIENTCLGLSGKRDIVIALLLTLHLLVVADCCVRICTDFPWIDAARHLNRWIPLLSTSSVCAMSCHVV